MIGIFRTRYQTVPRLAAHIKSGQVIEFFFPVGAQGSDIRRPSQGANQSLRQAWLI